ncbi:MAG: hypothetical protein E6J86_12095, partial [Deltaproteobacteria bacterium]
LDLHVLGTPPAFVLSQDQTLQLNFIGASAPGLTSLRTSLKALRYPQSASWTCYPVFKDRAPATPLRTTNCLPRLATGARFLPLSAVSCQGPRVPPSRTPHTCRGRVM